MAILAMQRKVSSAKRLRLSSSVAEVTPPAPEVQAFSERVIWRTPLRGLLQPDDKDVADSLAVGGLYNAAESVSKLTFLAAFGLRLGRPLKGELSEERARHIEVGPPEQSWIHCTCEAWAALKSGFALPLMQ